MIEDRFDRQRRLSDVGAEGQARIERWDARVQAGPGAAVAMSYLVRAGVEKARVESPRGLQFPHAEHFRFSGPRAVASGAHAALSELRRALAAQGESR